MLTFSTAFAPLFPLRNKAEKLGTQSRCVVYLDVNEWLPKPFSMLTPRPDALLQVWPIHAPKQRFAEAHLGATELALSTVSL